MTTAIEIHGSCDERFGRVRETFEAGFASGAEIGAAVCVVIEGQRVVDLWAGWADQARTRPWQQSTLVNVFSTTKGMTALCALRLVDAGRLDLDAPVAHYWPEFAAGGKEGIPVRYLLSHQAGLPAVRDRLPPEALFDWETMVSALASQEPWWDPGALHGYHAVTFGWLVGEVVRRISGKSLGTYFQEEVAEPLGADFYIGFGPELDERVADLVQGPVQMRDGPSVLEEIIADPEGMLAKAFNNPSLILGNAPMSREWRAAEIPAANGHASASAIATIYGEVSRNGASGGSLLSANGIALAREEQAYGKDAVLPLTTRIGHGFMLQPAEETFGSPQTSFNHAGAGGSLGYCDPEARIGFGYVMNHMHMGAWLVDPRARNLVDALYEGL